jgi:hypothetical protein
MPAGNGLARSVESVLPLERRRLLARKERLLASWGGGLLDYRAPTPSSSDPHLKSHLNRWLLSMPNFHMVGDHNPLVVALRLDGPDGEASVAQFLA